jgi:hypothetical protein
MAVKLSDRRRVMAGFAQCAKCGMITDNLELRSTEANPNRFICPFCVESMKRLGLIK